MNIKRIFLLAFAAILTTWIQAQEVTDTGDTSETEDTETTDDTGDTGDVTLTSSFMPISSTAGGKSSMSGTILTRVGTAPITART